MTHKRLTKSFVALWIILFSLSGNASVCLILGDSQTAVSLEKKKGLAPSLRDELQKRGYSPVFYALKGVKANTWIEKSPVKEFVAKGEGNNNFRPFQATLAESGREKVLTFNNSGEVSFLEQIQTFHQDDQIDCILIQIGDADLFNSQGPQNTVRLVQEAKRLFPNMKSCGILPPSVKDAKGKDDYPFIKNKNKENYTTRLKYHMGQSSLQQTCPVLDTISEEFKRRVEDLDQRITFDGLIYNDFGGKLLVKEALNQHPVL